MAETYKSKFTGQQIDDILAKAQEGSTGGTKLYKHTLYISSGETINLILSKPDNLEGGNLIKLFVDGELEDCLVNMFYDRAGLAFIADDGQMYTSDFAEGFNFKLIVSSMDDNIDADTVIPL